jgi:DNA-binding NarL/FixJ family response regulator
MSPSTPITRRVVIVEDQSALHGMMKAVVEGVPGYRVAGYAKDVVSARELCRKEKPALVILDLGLPQGSGLTLLPELRTISPLSRVMIFSGHLRAATIRAALLSGAHGLVEKTAPLEEFEQALRSVGSGQVYFSRFASEEIRRLVQRRAGGPPPIVRLTEREKAVLRAVAEGLSSKQISARLGLSWHTVVNHRTRLAKKIRVRGVARLSRYAVRIGLLDPEVEGAADATAD